MERVVIIAKGADTDKGLIELLKAMFPECEIWTISPNAKNPEAYPKGSLSGSRITDAKSGIHSKHLNRR